MKMITLLSLLLLLCLSCETSGYKLSVNYSGDSFFNGWNFFTAADPTHGYVTFVNEQVAKQKGYISTNGNSPVYIGADKTNKASGAGRESVRITSQKTFNGGLFIIDLLHMPTGCGTWPAWWTVGPNWPNSGEIDIIEGVNNGAVDQTTLHTNAGCDMTNEDHSKFSGHMVTGNCNAPGNAGCGIQAGGNSYGDGFNGIKGGVFALEWTSDHIQSFFFPRNSIPGDITNNNPNPAGWGKPYAYFQLGGNCPSSHFANHNIVFDLTFCGDWAGAVFAQQCPNKGTCQSYVQNNPDAFANAYWLINYVKVFN